VNQYTEGNLECNGLKIRCVELGAGQPVVVFPAAGANLFDDVVTRALATRYCVIALDVPTSVERKNRAFAQQLAQALAQRGVAAFSVVGIVDGATPALLQAAVTPDVVQRLVLISPSRAAVLQPQCEAKLSDVKAPTLVLVGTRDRSGSREAGHTCRAQIPTCHLLLVYEAGQSIATDRQEACLAPIREFLDQGEGFIVSHESQLIRP
jgi:pimeloyl-ACP methyl ester carboxylesterase